MQDNNWTDDGAFYDDAWKDMSARLDGRSTNKKFVYWPWLALLLLLGSLGGAYAYFNQSTPERSVYADEALPRVQHEEAAQSVPATSNGTSQESLGQSISGKTGNEGLQSAQIARTAARFGKVGIQQVRNGATEVRTTNDPVDLGTSQIATETYSSPEPASPNPNEDSSNINLITASIEAEKLPVRNPSVIQRVPSLPFDAPVEESPTNSSFSIDEIVTEASKLQRLNKRRSLFVEAGVSSSPLLAYPGYYLGTGYTFNLAEKFELPVGLRLRQDAQQITSIDLSRSMFVDPNNVVSGPLTGAPSLNSYSGQLLNNLESADIDRVKYQSMELTAGINYRLGRKLKIGGVLSASYLHRLSGPQVANSDGRQLFDLNLDNSSDRFDLEQAGSFDPGTQRLATITRYLIGVELNASYAINRRFDLSFSARHILSNQTENGVVKFNPGRLGLGARYYLR